MLPERLGLAESVEAVEPTDGRAEVVATARRILAVYGEPDRPEDRCGAESDSGGTAVPVFGDRAFVESKDEHLVS